MAHLHLRKEKWYRRLTIKGLIARQARGHHYHHITSQ